MKTERRCKHKMKVKSRGIQVEYCLRYHHTVTESGCRQCGEEKEVNSKS